MRFKKQKVLVECVKKITRRHFEGERKGYVYWSAPFTLEAVRYLRTGNFRLTPELVEKESAATRPIKLDMNFTITGLQRELRHFQYEGVAFLEAMLKEHPGAIIGDEPGLGKTAQFLAYLQRHPEERTAVIVCPATLKLNWAKEIFLWMIPTPENRVYLLSGMTRRTCEEITMYRGRLVIRECPIPAKGIFIINYNIVIDWYEVLLSLKPKIIAFDEAQALKNKKTMQTDVCMKLATGNPDDGWRGIPKRIPITGTLFENNVQELFNSLSMVRPDLFTSWFKFNERYNKEMRTKDRTLELHKLIKLACIRRKKRDVLKELPPKIKSVIPLNITNSSEYMQAENNFLSWIKGTKGQEASDRAMLIKGLARINALKEIAVKGKIDACIKWIENYLESGEKLVVFAEHTWIVDKVCKHFKGRAVMIDGRITGVKRNEAVERFQTDPNIVLFMGQIKAAGTGLTLTAASATCTLQLVWNPKVHEQADDRVHRIGQEDSVNNYYLISSDTIEEDLAYGLDEKDIEAALIMDGEEVVSVNLLSSIMRRMKERHGL
jgi:SNF2 family DNA or RNA helicase